MSEAVFQKHNYSQLSKKKVKLIEEFDPRPLGYRGTAFSRLPTFLNSVCGLNLCVYLLFEESCQHWSDHDKYNKDPSVTSVANIPTVPMLRDTIQAFEESLCVSEEKACGIKQDTREQRNSSCWHQVRRYQLTSSMFGAVLSLRDNTPPDSLVLRIMQPKQFSSPATKYGIEMESVALSKYVEYQQCNGHPDLAVCPSGFFVSKLHSFLGTSPDGAVYDPCNTLEPFGFEYRSEMAVHSL